MVEVKTPSIVLAAMTALLTGERLFVVTIALLQFTTPVSDLLSSVVAILGIPSFVVTLLIVLAFLRVFVGNPDPSSTSKERACLVLILARLLDDTHDFRHW